MFLLVWSYEELLRTGQRVHRPPLSVFDGFQCAISTQLSINFAVSRAILHFLGVDLQCWPLYMEISHENKQCFALLTLARSQRFIILLRNLLEESLKGSLPLAEFDAEWQLPIPTIKHEHRKHETWNGQTTTSSSVQQ